MLKTLIFGFVLGIVATVAAVYYIPVVDQHRESSVISVTPNGGNSEAFYISIPMDRIMIGAPDQPSPLPPELEWPEDEVFDGVRAELFKVRNAKDIVVGVASRVAAQNDQLGDSIEWVLHLPARGTFFVSMPVQSSDGSQRVGSLRAGTREFRSLNGQVSERWIASTNAESGESPDGRIELITRFVGEHVDVEPMAEVAEEAR